MKIVLFVLLGIIVFTFICVLLGKRKLKIEEQQRKERERKEREHRTERINKQRESIKNDKEKQKELLNEYHLHTNDAKAEELADILRGIVTQETKDELAKSYHGYHDVIKHYTFNLQKDRALKAEENKRAAQRINPTYVSEQQGQMLQGYADSLKYKPAPPPKEKSVIGSAVAGGIIAGPAGAVVGAIHAADKNSKIRSEK